MKKFLPLIGLSLIACNPPPTAPSVSVYVNQTVSLADGGRPDGVVSGSCNPVDRVNISAFPSQLVVGQSERIDVTPKDAQGQPRDPDCDIATGVKWSHSDDCSIQDDEAFVTEVKGEKKGTCKITATVSGKSDSESFSVN